MRIQITMNRCSMQRSLVALSITLSAFVLSACTTVDLTARDEPVRSTAPASPSASSSTTATPTSPTAEAKKSGGYYKDDGPGDAIPDGLVDTPDAEPKIEPIAKGPSKPYTILDQTYVPITDDRP